MLATNGALRPFLTLSLAAALLVPLTGCGDDGDEAAEVPEGAVAIVGEKPITKERLDRWVALADKLRPTVEQCVADAVEGGADASSPRKRAELTQQCSAAREAQETPEAIKQQEEAQLSFLIQLELFKQAALDYGVTVADSNLEAAAKQVGKERYPKRADYRRYLASSEFQMERERVLGDVLVSLLLDAIRGRVDAVTDEDVEEEYDRRRLTDFTIPESRTVTSVANFQRSGAQQARKALEDGDSWKSVGGRFSTTTPPGVQTSEYSRTQTNEGINAIFAARKGEISGPIKGELGWTVFEVTKIQPRRVIGFNQPDERFEGRSPAQMLRSGLGGNSGMIADKAVEDFYADWRKRTNCLEGYIVQRCGNAPVEQPTGQPQL